MSELNNPTSILYLSMMDSLGSAPSSRFHLSSVLLNPVLFYKNSFDGTENFSFVEYLS
jgi:hypothetical protein